MANPLDNLKPFVPGQSGNPGGKPTGARNRLTAHFLNALADDFQEHGKQAILDARAKDPMGYVKAIAALMPKQIEQTRPLDDMNDAELLALLEYLRTRITQNAGAGASEKGVISQAH